MKIGNPSSSSKSLTCLLRDGCARKSRSAARVMVAASATATMYFKCLNSTRSDMAMNSSARRLRSKPEVNQPYGSRSQCQLPQKVPSESIRHFFVPLVRQLVRFFHRQKVWRHRQEVLDRIPNSLEAESSGYCERRMLLFQRPQQNSIPDDLRMR